MADDSKTEKASPKKRRDERKKGNVFKSQDIIVVISLLGCFLALYELAPFTYRVIREFMVTYIENIGTMDTLNNETAAMIENQMIVAATKTIVPIMLISVVLAVLAVGIQTKFLFSAQSLAPKFSRINPIAGIKKLFSMKNVVELIKNILKISLLIYLIIDFMRDRMLEIPRTMNIDLQNSIKYIVAEMVELIKLVCMWFAAIAGFDFMYQRWDYERQIKMSKQEVKEEYKQTEGNPEIKGKIKSMQQQRARSRMMQAVPTADVVIRNPTHFAVALKYDTEVSSAPVVVAKGQDELALRIVKVAEENHVYVMEDKPLARFIYGSTKLNQEIPPEVYGAVAEILVYIYKLNNKEINS